MAQIHSGERDRLHPLAAKVPEITLLFWVLKLLTTGMGEAMSDFLGQQNVPLAAAIGIFGLWFALRLQMRTRYYQAPAYWFAVMMVAIFGTMAADGVHDGASIPYCRDDAAVRRDRRARSSSAGTAARARSRSTASRPAAARGSTGRRCSRRSHSAPRPAISPRFS